MILYKTPQEIEKIRVSSLLVSATLTEVATQLKAGITTLFLDQQIEKYIKNKGAIPAFKNYKGFPFSACISVNDVVVHGFPNETVLKEGDIVSIDIGVLKDHYYGDSAYTFGIGKISEDNQLLLIRTKKALLESIKLLRIGNRLGDISNSIQEATEVKYGYGVVRDLVGHGIGRNLHEDPSVPNYGKKGQGPLLKEGLVIAIEPMINLGTKNVYVEKDGWTIKTQDHQCSAHFEHTVALTKQGADILSDFSGIEKAIASNAHLWNEQ